MMALGMLLAGIAPVRPVLAWESTRSVGDDGPYCAMTDSFPDGTRIMFVITDEFHDEDVIALAAGNRNWNFGPDNVPGTIQIVTSNGHFGESPAFAFLGGFGQYLQSAQFGDFIEAATRGGGFTLRHNGEEVGRYPAEGMFLAYSVLLECARAEFDSRDPFAG